MLLTKGTASVGGNSLIAETPSHLAIAPENLLCMLLSVASGIHGISPLRNALPARAAIPKFIDLIFIDSECRMCVLFIRAHWVPIRR
jgi:hypothetical protein